MNPDERKDLIFSIYDPKIGYDMEKFYESAAPDMVFVRHPFPPVVGVEANRASDEAMLAAFSDYQVIIEQLIAEGDTIAMVYSWKATHSGPLPTLGVPATGKPVDCKGCMLFYFKDDKIIRCIDYFDMLGFMQQLGLIPAMA